MKGHYFPATVKSTDANKRTATVVYDGFLIGDVTYKCKFTHGGAVRWQDVLLDVSGGGDLVYARQFAGFDKSARFCSDEHICNKCVASKAQIFDNSLAHRQRSYVRSCHLAHKPAHPLDFPFSCPIGTCGCAFQNQAEVDAHHTPPPLVPTPGGTCGRAYYGSKKAKCHYKAHEGQGFGQEPASCIEHRNFDDCVMHARKALAGMLLDEAILK
jgi:hypothetical protein